jgi:hypothetical protein
MLRLGRTSVLGLLDRMYFLVRALRTRIGFRLLLVDPAHLRHQSDNSDIAQEVVPKVCLWASLPQVSCAREL